ncbi:hypothetical protein FRX31_011363 [Thalictrum thalictroides]|uniref:Uncharacterized protein n=1 Tax=Thalictrum thalictroides TaxID=46969 RepID=A0A7J6WNU3_THATH|nr:hypothetical protein FRX31_011363 [Thalictrum thalictroides]
MTIRDVNICDGVKQIVSFFVKFRFTMFFIITRSLIAIDLMSLIIKSKKLNKINSRRSDRDYRELQHTVYIYRCFYKETKFIVSISLNKVEGVQNYCMNGCLFAFIIWAYIYLHDLGPRRLANNPF